MPRRMVCDRWLFCTVLLMALGGFFMVGSSSNYMALESGKSPSAFYLQHGLHMLLGVAALFTAMNFDYRRFNHRLPILGLAAGALALLIFVLSMPAAGGAHRWIPIGPLNLQPSEFTKLVAVLFMAYMLSRKEDRVNDLWAVPIPCFVILGGLALLIGIEPDLGSAVILCVVAAVMIFVAGLRWRYIAMVGAVGTLGIAVAVYTQPWRLQRIQGWLDPSLDPLGVNFQLNQSLIAIGSGGLTGLGFGQGQQKASYIFGSHTDFIFSVIGEELGLIGTSVLLLAFLLLFWRGLRAASRAPDRFGFYLALGITSLMVFQGLVNMSVCLGLFPTKGLPLPLISYGGSSLLASMIAMGILLNISQHSN
jgi:cell division protein FtsW